MFHLHVYSVDIVAHVSSPMSTWSSSTVSTVSRFHGLTCLHGLICLNNCSHCLVFHGLPCIKYRTSFHPRWCGYLTNMYDGMSHQCSRTVTHVSIINILENGLWLNFIILRFHIHIIQIKNILYWDMESDNKMDVDWLKPGNVIFPVLWVWLFVVLVFFFFNTIFLSETLLSEHFPCCRQ